MKEYVFANVKAFIGDYTYGHDNINIRQFGNDRGSQTLRIGKFCSIAMNITCHFGGYHHSEWLSTYPFGHREPNLFGPIPAENDPYTKGDINIGNDVWIADNVVIMCGVTIGDGAVIANNSHVVKDVKPYEIVGGNPAKHIKYRFDKEVVDLMNNFKWWNLPNDKIKEIRSNLQSPPNKQLVVDLIGKYKEFL